MNWNEAQRQNVIAHLRRALACLEPQATPQVSDDARAALRAEVAGYVAGELERRRATLLTLIVEAEGRGDGEAARLLSQPVRSSASCRVAA